MKVILLEDVKPHGKKGDVVDVSDGYAKNFLIPKKKGVEANASNMKNLEHQKKKEADNAAAALAEAETLKEQIEAKRVTVQMKKGEGERAFGSVSSKEIAQALQEQHGITVDKKKIVLPEVLKTFGEHEVTVKLHAQVPAVIHLVVEESK